MTSNTFQVVGTIVRKHPFSTLGVPLAVLVILTGLGVYGALAGAASVSTSNQDTAYSVAVDESLSFTLYVERAFAPLVTLNSFIQQTPYVPDLLPQFSSIATGLLDQLPPNTFASLQFSPFGHIMGETPNRNQTGIDIFGSASLRSGAITTLVTGQTLLSGPLPLVFDISLFGAPTRMPIFVSNVSANETFGTNWTLPTNITLEQAYNKATRTKFWGFVTAIILFNDVQDGTDPTLAVKLTQKGYLYRLSSQTELIGSSNPQPPQYGCVSFSFNMTNQIWTLSLYPEGGWCPTWKWPVVAAVVIISFIIALLVFIMNVSLKHQSWLLSEMVRTNKELAQTTRDLHQEQGRMAAKNKELAGITCDLQAEKARMDALLVRQYNLIQCFSSTKTSNDNPLTADSTAVDRIESMRKQLNSENVRSLAETEQIQTLEVLGWGSFGKVYKGLWRGTEVAVKTMMLAADLSGAEKREKMAVMEAAISSSLSHPNIVSTYTYSIKPVRDTTSAGPQLDPSLIVLTGGSTVDGNTLAGTNGVTKRGDNGNAGLVHSYEVRLVLEYCDLGSLKEAVDQGAFMSSSNLNYCAILDTALDISKAMCHLHAMNVLHSDLKARNVMLKSSGEGRGFTAKVADFGLSVKMNNADTHMSNMYQGTMTHMAPELLMEGRISKAADVYAFGVTMWELFTGGNPFQGTPKALLGHMITKENRRPAFTRATPEEYRQLAERCWLPDYSLRPSFDEIFIALKRMRAAVKGQTARVHVQPPTPKHPEDSGGSDDHGNSWKFDAGASGVAKCLPRGTGKGAKSTVVALCGSVLEVVEEVPENTEGDSSRLGSVSIQVDGDDVGIPVPGSALLQKQSEDVLCSAGVQNTALLSTPVKEVL
ncbi:hypothetical protein CEUSTIGMA_g1626.t1 [Chlamydomonas eustigma]|uniref:Protein kinase domain-containing protein n=1 Tax=Chlamydomonas eustigma TaxID=1157962 RepID=A0A250WTM1_9CHLO|nr:hypothetical protein CEUSTIGMA_g1626.t1 [Chlamydomonas eustigma]|eukprot:GAX74177.1 hypothetical protein CEUSTIGMA_g1626.t1 [Chlamydomonas eustigma]